MTVPGRARRSRPPTSWLAPLALALAAGSASAESPFAVRAIKLAGSPADPVIRSNAEFAFSIGFNALWVYSNHAGRWADPGDGSPPALDPAFEDLARSCRDRGVRLFVSVNPPADSRQRFVYSEPDGERRIIEFFQLLRRRAGVHDFVLSFDDQPLELREIRDILRYGRSASPAHLDLTGRVARSLSRKDRLWLCAGSYSDVHLGNRTGPYSGPLLAGLAALPPRVGIVWTGSEPIAPSISAPGIRKTRALLGGRDLLLYDNFAAFDPGWDALAVYLGPLRDRDPELASEVSVYLVCALSPPPVSHLALLTAADFLADPSGYDAETSWRKAIRRLAGDRPEAIDALLTQTLEWRGWDRGKPYRPWDPIDPEEAAESLEDPAIVASWDWAVRRYPGRIEALAALEDREFRDHLVEILERRLAVARTVPLAVEYLARLRAGRRDLDPLIEAIRSERDRASRIGSALLALDAFLAAAGIPAPSLPKRDPIPSPSS